jgi:hypothetical protein
MNDTQTATAKLCLGEPMPTTKQEYLDLILRKSREGKFPSREPRKQCLYRLGDRACLVGLLISDEEYNSKMEGLVVQTVYEDKLAEPPTFLSVDELKHLQIDCHDTFARCDEEWEHDKFISRLRESGIFSDCVFPE